MTFESTGIAAVAGTVGTNSLDGRELIGGSDSEPRVDSWPVLWPGETVRAELIRWASTSSSRWGEGLAGLINGEMTWGRIDWGVVKSGSKDGELSLGLKFRASIVSEMRTGGE
jgi:hypothetical protein